MYIANPDAAKLGKPAQDLPAEALAAVKASANLWLSGCWQLDALSYPIHLGQSGTPWAAMVSVPMDEVLAPRWPPAINRADCPGLCAGLGWRAVSGAVRLLRPLEFAVARAMSYLSSGSGDLTRRMEVTSQDEIGKVAEAFNAFVGSCTPACSAKCASTPSIGQAYRRGWGKYLVRWQTVRSARPKRPAPPRHHRRSHHQHHPHCRQRARRRTSGETARWSSPAIGASGERSSSEIGQIAGTVRHLNDNLAALEAARRRSTPSST